MKLGYIALISSSVLLVAGIMISAVWTVQVAGSFTGDNTVLAHTSMFIDPGTSVSAIMEVSQLDRPVYLGFGINKTSSSFIEQQPSQIPSLDLKLKEEVIDPNGRVIISNEFGNGYFFERGLIDSFFTSFKPEMTGVYTVTVSNL